MAALSRTARPLHAADRGDHPEGAGRGDPGAAARGHDHHRRPRHRQDRGRAAPRGLPALHGPAALRVRRRAGRRARTRCSSPTSSGCCRPSARPPSSLRALGEVVDGIRATRHDGAGGRRGQGLGADACRCWLGPRGATCPARRRAFRIFYRDDVLRLDQPRADRRTPTAAERRAATQQGRRQGRPASSSGRCGSRPRAIGRASTAATSSRARCATAVSSSSSSTPGGRWSMRSRCWAGSPTASGWPASLEGVLTPRRGRAECPRRWSAVLDGDALGRGRAADRRAALPARRAPRPRRRRGRDDPVSPISTTTLVPELWTTRDGRLRHGRDRHVGGRRGRPLDRGRRYAHVLVDEAQDLSPMQWRMLGRRGATRSWTIVGDAAQSSGRCPPRPAGS